MNKPELDPQALARVDALIQEGLRQNHYLTAVYAIVSAEAVLASRAFGTLCEEGGQAATLETVFDLASLTKPVCTVTAVMALAERGVFHLGEEARSFLGEDAGPQWEGVTLRHLLTHTSGLPAWRKFHSQGLEKREIVTRVLATERERPVGSRYVYSDLGFITLGEIVERVTGDSLDVVAGREVFTPLGMADTGFRPGEALRERLAPTRCPDRARVLAGEVHDGNAASMGGVAGHAGLFAPAGALVRYAQMVLREGEADGRAVLSSLAVRAMATPQLDPAVGGATLGWFCAPNGMLPRGDLLPLDTFGHTGFTGTSLLITPSLGVATILLTNRVYFPADAAPFLRFRRRFHNAVAGALRFR
jgi:CubicO group peptidase (beta-lactamase class C family)